MSQKRIRKGQNAVPVLPYWRSILATFVLVLSMMIFFAALADPHSGELRSPGLVAPMFVGFGLVEVAVFYAEFRFRRKRPPAAVRQK